MSTDVLAVPVIASDVPVALVKVESLRMSTVSSWLIVMDEVPCTNAPDTTS